MKKQFVQVGDEAQLRFRRIKVLTQSDVPGHWVTEVVEDPDPDEVGQTRIYSGGTIAMFKVKPRIKK